MLKEIVYASRLVRKENMERLCTTLTAHGNMQKRTRQKLPSEHVIRAHGDPSNIRVKELMENLKENLVQ
jgi:hypothetical protein